MLNISGMLPEFIAKWITGHGIAPRTLSVHHSDTDVVNKSSTEETNEGDSPSTPEPPMENPIVRKLSAFSEKSISDRFLVMILLFDKR